jgi:hypothetical protein
MFTIEQIKSAHTKVKSGADFPNYFKDLIQLGVTSYEAFVADVILIILAKLIIKLLHQPNMIYYSLPKKATSSNSKAT